MPSPPVKITIPGLGAMQLCYDEDKPHHYEPLTHPSLGSSKAIEVIAWLPEKGFAEASFIRELTEAWAGIRDNLPRILEAAEPEIAAAIVLNLGDEEAEDAKEAAISDARAILAHPRIGMVKINTTGEWDHNSHEIQLDTAAAADPMVREHDLFIFLDKNLDPIGACFDG